MIDLIGRLKAEGVAALVVEQNAPTALAVVRPRLRHGPRHASSTRGRPASCATTPRGAAGCWGCERGGRRSWSSIACARSTRAAGSAAQVTFSIEADLAFAEPAIVGMMGANGAGKTTLFELMTGSSAPTAGRVLCLGQDINAVKRRERDRLAMHYHQSYQVRRVVQRDARRAARARRVRDAASCTSSTSRSSAPRTATSASCSTSSAACAREGKLVFVCLHPTERVPPGDPARALRALRLRPRRSRVGAARLRRADRGPARAGVPHRGGGRRPGRRTFLTGSVLEARVPRRLEQQVGERHVARNRGVDVRRNPADPREDAQRGRAGRHEQIQVEQRRRIGHAGAMRARDGGDLRVDGRDELGHRLHRRHDLDGGVGQEQRLDRVVQEQHHDLGIRSRRAEPERISV